MPYVLMPNVIDHIAAWQTSRFILVPHVVIDCIPVWQTCHYHLTCRLAGTRRHRFALGLALVLIAITGDQLATPLHHCTFHNWNKTCPPCTACGHAPCPRCNAIGLAYLPCSSSAPELKALAFKCA
eukprot:1162128-Pelagomonas_calceolata.AAC.7